MHVWRDVGFPRDCGRGARQGVIVRPCDPKLPSAAISARTSLWRKTLMAEVGHLLEALPRQIFLTVIFSDKKRRVIGVSIRNVAFLTERHLGQVSVHE